MKNYINVENIGKIIKFVLFMLGNKMYTEHVFSYVNMYWTDKKVD